MDSKNSLHSIGEIANICGVTPKTVRFYDKMDLVKPAWVNLKNGYRFYSKDAVTHILMIKEMQELGMSLAKISQYYNKVDDRNQIGKLQEILEAQRQEIREQIELLEKKEKKLNIMLDQCKKLDNTIDDKNEISIKEIPDRQIVYEGYKGKYSPDIFRDNIIKIKNIIQNENVDMSMFYPYPIAIFDYKHDNPELDIMLGFQIYEGISIKHYNQIIIAGGIYATCTAFGNYEKLKKEIYPKLCKEIKNKGYEIESIPITIFFINESITNNKEDYRTEIQIKIRQI